MGQSKLYSQESPDPRVSMQTVPSYPVSIFIAGDIDVLKQACREFCMTRGLCVTVTETDYIYTGGSEGGAVIGLINYGRYPAQPSDIENAATDLGLFLMDKACQNSFSIQTPVKTYYLSRRAETDRRLAEQRSTEGIIK